jgi:hypothetical protein
MKPTLWSCSGGGRVIFVLAHHPVSWHNVRSFVSTVLLADEPTCVVALRGSPQYELQWVGSDAGEHPDKRMQVRDHGQDWKDVR